LRNNLMKRLGESSYTYNLNLGNLLSYFRMIFLCAGNFQFIFDQLEVETGHVN
jgi:hypothetical protein